jgi:uncharacterized protein (TIGR02646 family)
VGSGSETNRQPHAQAAWRDRMIYVRKPAAKVPKAFLELAAREIAEVARRGERRRGSYPFAAYRHKSLKKALESIFGKKCAYCETQYEVGGYLEVEHYRPKNIYYWLAADWSNLLPACKRCNNGKLTKFPLADASRQAKKKGQERRESPLLLNPSDPSPARRPEKHLTFDVYDGSIRARLIAGQPSALGLKSIEVYRLTRTGLARARKSWAQRVWLQALMSDPVRRRTLNDTQRKLMNLAERDMRDISQPYRALTREILRERRKQQAGRRRRA